MHLNTSINTNSLEAEIPLQTKSTSFQTSFPILKNTSRNPNISIKEVNKQDPFLQQQHYTAQTVKTLPNNNIKNNRQVNTI
jgi:hypothetical protein